MMTSEARHDRPSLVSVELQTGLSAVVGRGGRQSPIKRTGHLLPTFDDGIYRHLILVELNREICRAKPDGRG
jgi:hypothetical protein